MSEPKKKHSDPEELPLFEDLSDPGAVGRGGAGPDAASSSGRKKGEAALPDFDDENDRTSALPPVTDMPGADDAYPGRRGARADAEEEDPPESRTGGRAGSRGRKPIASIDVTPPGGLTPSKPKDAVKEEKKGKKDDSSKKKKKTREKSLKKSEDAQTSRSARTVFIVCMILLSPLALLLFLAVLAIFALLFTSAILIAGALALALIALVVAGVVLALTGITYGLIQMVSKSGFSFYAGQYELGLGLAITGITIITSSLLYAGATNLVPFIVKQLSRLLKFLWKKIRELFKKVYDYSTHL